MSIQKGKHQSGQTQGYSQRYPHAPTCLTVFSGNRTFDKFVGTRQF